MSQARAIVLMLGCLTACKSGSSNRAPEGSPEQLARAFLRDVESGDDTAGYAKLCRGYANGVSKPSFARAVQSNAYLHAAPKLNFANASMQAGGWSVSGPLETTLGSVGIEVHGGTEEPQRLCISGILLGGTPVLPTPGALVQGTVIDGG